VLTTRTPRSPSPSIFIFISSLVRSDDEPVRTLRQKFRPHKSWRQALCDRATRPYKEKIARCAFHLTPISLYLHSIAFVSRFLLVKHEFVMRPRSFFWESAVLFSAGVDSTRPTALRSGQTQG
jgi:hypothetical protein